MRRAHGLSAAPQALLCSAPGAPEAPVWRPGPQDGVVPLDACHPRHMGPHSAAGGAVSGLQPTPAAPVRDCGREGRQIALVRPTTGHRSRNPTGPEMMTAHERLAEVASLLARGFLRARLRAAEKRQNGLAISRYVKLHISRIMQGRLLCLVDLPQGAGGARFGVAGRFLLNIIPAPLLGSQGAQPGQQ